MQFKNSSDAAQHLWDYFNIRNYPTDNERKAWHLVENATQRIRESEQLLRDKYPAAVRLKNARRVKRAVRVILRLVADGLESIPDGSVGSALGYIEVLSEQVIEESAEAAKLHPLH